MTVRLATFKDFGVYKTLYHKIECSVLYQPDKSDIKPQTDEKSQKWELDEETLKQIEEATKITPEKFDRKIANMAEYRIYIIEEDDFRIGFAELFRIARTRWKLAELSFKSEYCSLKCIREVTDILVTMSSIKTIDVCVPKYPSCEQRMIESNFNSIGGGFFQKERQKS